MSVRSRIELWLESALSQAEDPEERIRALVRDLRQRQSKGRDEPRGGQSENQGDEPPTNGQ